jgi:glutathione synthase/RimK-type ligase-like ATP-grasp enzyme
VILICGRGDDAPIDRALDAAVDAGVDHLLVDLREAEHHDLVLRCDNDGLGGVLVHAGEHIELASIDAVYARPVGGHAGVRAMAFVNGLLEWLDTAHCLVVSRPACMCSNGSKLSQARLAAAAGFAVPATIVTDDPAAVRAFAERHGRVVYKSVSGVRSIVRELDEEARGRLARVRDLPVQFQELVEGVDVRVHVVGGSAFATEVRSAATDYRYAAREGITAELVACELEPDVERRCVALAEELGLPFCGIDLRCRGDGSVVCFEINPMPAFAYYEASTGQPIAAALIEMLAASSTETRRVAC